MLPNQAHHYQILPIKGAKISSQIQSYIQNEWLNPASVQTDFHSFPEIDKKALIKKGPEIQIHREIQNYNQIYKTCKEKIRKYLPILNEFQINDNCFLIVMEFPYKTYSLQDFISRGHFIEIRITRTIIKQILKVVYEFHRKLIAHCDLTCLNIYMSCNQASKLYNIQITDFSQAIIGEEIKTLHPNSGDANYFNFKFFGLTTYPRLRDIYSIGVIFYLLLFGTEFIFECKHDGLLWIEILKCQDVINAHKKRWDSRSVWANIKNFLHSNGVNYKEIILIRDLLFYLLRDPNANTKKILENNDEWLYYGKCTTSEIDDHIASIYY